MEIGNHTIVALRYIMYNGEGDVLENSLSSSPVNYLHGSKGILPLLQQQLEGLKEGDKKEVLLPKISGSNDEFRFDVIIDHVRAATEEEIWLGYPLRVYDKVCDETCDCYH